MGNWEVKKRRDQRIPAFSTSYLLNFSFSYLTSSRNSRHDRDAVSVLQAGLFLIRETDVLFIHIDVNEPPYLAAARKPLLDPRVILLQGIDKLRDVPGAALHLGLAVGQLLQGSGDPHFYRHVMLLLTNKNQTLPPRAQRV